MSLFHSAVRDVLENVHIFLYSMLQSEVLSSAALANKEKLLACLKNLQNEYPELHLNFMEAEGVRTSNPPSSPLSYMDMNGVNQGKSTFFPQNVDKEKYDICLPSETNDSIESHSVAESEGYTSDEAKCLPEIPASELYSSSKSGYLDKKKRESIKGWLNPFQKRWCAIRSGVLYYYEKSTDRRQRGHILLAGYEARTVADDTKDGKKYSHCFELVCPGKRTYQFVAPSEIEMQQWISTVEVYSKINNQAARLSSKLSFDRPPLPKPTKPNDDELYEIVGNDESEKQSDDISKSEEENGANISLDPPVDDQILNYSDWYVGLWDCTGSDESELSFNRGDLIHVVSKEHDSFSWWLGESQGKVGFVPKTYLMEAYEAC